MPSRQEPTEKTPGGSEAGPSAPGRLDALDQRIILELQEDGRRSYRAIARSLGVSEGTVRSRARRLFDSGVLRILAFADPFRLGYSVLASIFLRVAPGSLEGVVKALTSWPEVMYVSSCTGRIDIYIQVICRDHEELWKLLAKRLPAIGVTETETLMELKVHKFAYSFPGMLPGASGGAS